MAWLVGAVIALVIISLWQSHEDHEQARATLLEVAPSRIDHIGIERTDRPTETFVRHKTRWFRAGGKVLTPVPGKALDALAKLAATPVLQWRSAEGLNLDKIGLAPPAVTITLNGHALAYGGLAAFGPQRFVRVGKRVAVIPASMSPQLPHEPDRPAPPAANARPAK